MKCLPKWLAASFCSAAIASLVAGIPEAAAQALEAPASWIQQADRRSAWFVEMPPGWHITTGPGSIFYDPEVSASNEFSIESRSFLFDVGDSREMYGILFGGRHLGTGLERYLSFEISKDGEFRVRSTVEGETTDLMERTAHAAIVPQPGGSPVQNDLAVVVGESAIDFAVNGEIVASLRSSDVDTDGHVGLRVGHSLDVHVTSLDIEAAAGRRELAPSRE